MMATAEHEVHDLLGKVHPTTDGASVDTAAGAKTISESPELDSLNKITETQKKMTEAKQRVDRLFTSMARDQSILGRAADSWGKMPLWQKVTGGVLLSVPFLSVGLIADIGFLLAIGGFNVVGYSTAGVLLDDLFASSADKLDSLQKEVSGITGVLEIVTNSLAALFQQVADALEKFKKENVKLANHISALSDDVEIMTIQVANFVVVEQHLRDLGTDLAKASTNLKGTVEQQTELLKTNQKKLKAVIGDSKKNQEALSDMVLKLAQVRASMGDEVAKAKKVSTALQATVATLSAAVIADQRKRAAFQQKLDGFISDDKVGVESVTGRFSDAEKQLVLVQEELVASNQRYKDLLDRQKPLVERMVELDKLLATRNKEKPVDLAEQMEEIDKLLAGKATTITAATKAALSTQSIFAPSEGEAADGSVVPAVGVKPA